MDTRKEIEKLLSINKNMTPVVIMENLENTIEKSKLPKFRDLYNYLYVIRKTNINIGRSNMSIGQLAAWCLDNIIIYNLR